MENATNLARHRMNSATFRLGTQGWSYQDWVGPFYPPGAAANSYLRHYAHVFDTVELDTTFYGPPRPDTILAWDAATPAGFLFTAKMPKAITHDKRLIDIEPDLVEFLTVMTGLGSKLGPILIQFPPSFEASEVDQLAAFAAILPEEFRYAVEFRHPSWNTPQTLALLEAHRLAWTIIDFNNQASPVHLTTDFAYIRWLGRRDAVKTFERVTINRESELAAWAVELDRIAQKTQRIYGFANNHYAGHSPATVRAIQNNLGLPTVDPPQTHSQLTLSLDP